MTLEPNEMPYNDQAVQYGATDVKNPNLQTFPVPSATTTQTGLPNYSQPSPYYYHPQPQGMSNMNPQMNLQPVAQPFYNAQPVVYTQPTVQAVSTTSHLLGQNDYSKDDNDAKNLLIIGLCLGIVWLFCFVRYQRSPSPRAKTYARTAGVLFFLQLFVSIGISLSLGLCNWTYY